MSIRTPVLFAFLILAGCTTYKSSQPVEVVRNALPLTIEKEMLEIPGLSSQASVLKFYGSHDFKMQWYDTLGISPRGDSLLTILSKAKYFGLIEDDYHLAKLAALRSAPVAHQQAAELDVFLTDAFLSFYRDLRSARVDPKTFSRIKARPIDTDALAALDQAITSQAIGKLLAVEPTSARYVALKNELRKSIDANRLDTASLKHRDQLVANLERLRWESARPARYLAVNVPSYQLRIFENDSVALQSRVIIGKSETPTPNIKSVIGSFIIYPYWHVPKSIVKEILPAIQADTSYLKKHNYEVLNAMGKVVKPSSVQWAKYDPENFPFVLRQREGYENTMGVIKFVFPNNYGVYLHDTNAKGLFRKADRALSHGCIRVQKAVDLAHYLARDDDTYVSPEDLDQYLQVQARMEVKVVKPLPVYLDYFTCEVEGDSVVFFDDIYKKDKALVDSLNRVKPSVQIIQ